MGSVQTESFTNEIQSTAVGITEVFGFFGNIFGPLIVDLGDKIEIDPYFLTAVLLILGIWPIFFIRETLNT